MLRTLTATLVVLVAALVASPSAWGATRVLHVDDPMDAQDDSPSLEPRPVSPDITALDVSYDDAGSVSVAVTYAGEHDQPPRVEVALGCADAPVLTIFVVRERSYSEEASPGWNEEGTAQLAGFDGRIGSTVHAPDGSRTVRAAFSHPEFAGRGYRCARARWDESGYRYFDDTAAGWFGGQEPARVTVAAAEDVATAAVRARLGSRFTRAGARYLRCPAQQLLNPSKADFENLRAVPDDGQARCVFWARRGASVALGSVTVTSAPGLPPTADMSRPAFYTRAWRRCGSPRGVLIDSLRANEPCGGPKLLAGDVVSLAGSRFPRALARRFSVWAHGTNTAGHGPLVRYRCTARHRMVQREGHPVRQSRVSCRNGVGDRFRVRFSMA